MDPSALPAADSPEHAAASILVGARPTSPNMVPPAEPKHVSFELLLPQPHQKNRLPMRVCIYPRDSVESIVTTVQNFWGIYHITRVVFEDEQGATIVPRYENFVDNMDVGVRLITDDPHTSHVGRSRLEPAMHPDAVSPEPEDRARRTTSPDAPRLLALPDPDKRDAGDAADASATSPRPIKKEQLASAEISVDNIVEGGRRKRAKFDSSELPLFVPTQVAVTASHSSISPQRHVSSQNGSYMPFHPRLGASPQKYDQPAEGLATPYSTNGPPVLRPGPRSTVTRDAAIGSLGMPTPAPTTESNMSDEEVALSLMWLSDMANQVPHGRIEMPVADDSLSGKAEVDSTADDVQDEGDAASPKDDSDTARHSRSETVSLPDVGSVSADDDDEDDAGTGDHYHGGMPLTASKARPSSTEPKPIKKPRQPKEKASAKPKPKANGAAKPGAASAVSRKHSTASTQHLFAADEEDLSSRPRCQRCRKSKKGCDRQRPCGRCKDAGIGMDGCISEDEGNGRKGRYGRHMGVPVKKASGLPGTPVVDAAHPAMSTASSTAPVSGFHVDLAADKSKKRKR